MHDGLVDFCRELKNMGFLVKLDSNGTHPAMLRSMFDDKLIDFVAMDVKAPLDRYREVVARPIDVNAIAESIKLIKSSGIDHEFRTTIVKSQLSPRDIEAIGQLIDGAERYAFQRFMPGKTLSPQFEFEQSYSDDEIGQMKTMMQKYVKHCVVH